jgi:uncharacterized protein (DUF885 family)
MRHSLPGFTLSLLLLLAPRSSAAAAPADHDQLWAMFDEQWEWRMRESPELATALGDDRYDDRLQNLSLDAIAKRKDHQRQILARAKAVDRSRLSPEDRLNLDLFIYPLEQEVAGYRFPEELLLLNQMGSPPADFAQLARIVPRARTAEVEAFLARMRAVPTMIDQSLVLLRKGLETGVTPPRVTLREVPKLLGNHIQEDPTQNPIYKLVFADLPASIPAADQERLRAEAKRILTNQVIPAYRKLQRFVVDSYLPGSRETLGMSSLPDGAAWYRYRIQMMTTTDRSPEDIHALGLQEVARIETEMDGQRKKAGFAGDRKAFFKFLTTDDRFFYTDKDALIIGYRDIAKRIDPELPKRFRTLPRLTYGVLPVPAYSEKTQTTAYYDPGAPEVGRAGIFFANTYDLRARPKWAMEDLVLHEAVPGHHLQFARAQELSQLPKFRRYGEYNAYVEGWGLYSETLGEELGMYQDPYSKFGQESGEIWRAIRLVVDTGIHAKGWTRQQAIDYFNAHSGKAQHDIEVEVDRYIVWPGQALGYKIGQLTIKDLRDEATRELGDRFDERDFHDQVLGAGALPLSILQARVREWVAGQKTASAPHAAR